MVIIKAGAAVCFLAAAAGAAESAPDETYATLRAGNLSGLRVLLGKGVSANARDDRGVTPLMRLFTPLGFQRR